MTVFQMNITQRPTSAGLVIKGTPKQNEMHQFLLLFSSLERINKWIIRDLNQKDKEGIAQQPNESAYCRKEEASSKHYTTDNTLDRHYIHSM